MKLRNIVIACAVFLIASITNSFAYTISYTQLTQGQSSVTNASDGWTASIIPQGSVFEWKMNNSLTASEGVGISGATAGEIDVREYLNFTFT